MVGTTTKAVRSAAIALVVLLSFVNAACTGTAGSNSQPGNGTLSVSISSPASGATVSGSVSVTATATDTVSISSVQFQVDGSNIGTAVTSSPYSMTWNTSAVSNGKHTLTAVATDASGAHATSSSVSVTVSNKTSDTTPPTVSITSPANNATVSGTISVTATASDNVAVESVQFDVDGGIFGTADTTSPYSQSLDTTKLTNGTHKLTAVATDTSNNKTTSAAVSITVSNKTSDTTPPTVSITSPANTATVSGTITVSANASDNVAVASVVFDVDGTQFGSTDTTSPYSQSLDTTKLSNGSHSLTAIATDTSNNKTTSAAVSITVSNKTSDTTPPTVSITSPANTATVSGTITVSANASDNVAVASVVFDVDGAQFGSTDTTSPYSQSLDTTKLSNGKHSLTAIATDTSNNKTTSAAVSISVSNTVASNVTVSITSPASNSTVSGTVTISATASSSAGIASVQFMIDGANFGSADTASPYSISWDTTTATSGAHTLSAKATDNSSNSATSSGVTVTVSQSAPPPPPPPPAGDDVTIADASGSGQTNRPISIARPFIQGEIADFAQASINGSPLLTQCDVKNRWPDGSLKFAIVSFVVPSIPANGSVVVSFSNQATGNNTGFLAQSDMTSSAYNFDGQIQLTGAASHTVSARAILNAAGSCNDPGNDPDSGQFICTYWLKGPVVTAVILEDRAGRSFDVNTDNGTGNPLHPIFEAWFYPQGNLVQLGYTLEDSWASTTPSNSARNQTYSVVLKGGSANPATVFSNSSFTQNTRTRWHKTFCVNGAGTGRANDCGALVHVDHNWPYMAATKFTPNWDPTLQIASSVMAGYYNNMFGTPSKTTLQGCSNCYGGGAGIGLYDAGFDSGGVDPVHGPLPTWEILYLMTQCDAGNSTSSACGNGSAGDMRSVMLTNSDLAGALPYWYREADASAGHGQFFDAPKNTVATQGRIVSIDARTQVNLLDATAQGSCNNNYAPDWINFGGSGQSFGVWGGAIDTSHWPNTAYASYISTGQYAYYEEQIMQAAYAVGLAGESTGNSRACDGPSGAARWGSAGYWENDQERGNDWQGRENMLGAFIAVDGSPEAAYLLDKVRANVAAWEGAHNIPCDVPGTGNTIPYCSGANNAWTFGNTVRINYPNSAGTALGGWALGVYTPQAPLNTTGADVPKLANSHFQTAYSTTMIGWLNDLGYCPGSCALLGYVANYYLNEALNPAANIYDLGDYVFPTLDQNGNQITSWAADQALYATHPTSFNGCNQDTDESYHLQGMAAMSYLTKITSSQGGYNGLTAYNKMRSLAGCITGPGNTFQSDSPKWDIVPRP